MAVAVCLRLCATGRDCRLRIGWPMCARYIANTNTNWTQCPVKKRAGAVCARLTSWAQVRAVRQTEVVKAAWRQDRPVVVHGWIYDLREGLLRDLDLN